MVRFTFLLFMILGATDGCCAQAPSPQDLLNFNPPPALTLNAGHVHKAMGTHAAQKTKEIMLNTRRARRLYNVAHKEKWLTTLARYLLFFKK